MQEEYASWGMSVINKVWCITQAGAEWEYLILLGQFILRVCTRRIRSSIVILKFSGPLHVHGVFCNCILSYEDIFNEWENDFLFKWHTLFYITTTEKTAAAYEADAKVAFYDIKHIN